VYAGRMEAFAASGARVILTPHPGELARLTGGTIEAIQGDRAKAARAAADSTGSIVVLKGAGTLVASPLGVPRLNLTGNPGMATGGTGDVLAGLLTGLAAQASDLQAAAEMAVWCHGHAGDRLAWKGSQAGLIAPDLLNIMPEVLRSVMPR
jgi:ADP-dependent NAD(P)H-hydrate dehydratase / NAD(P)H-hydrate epimerase